MQEKCTGLLHSGTALGIGDRPNCLSIKNWEGFPEHWWVIWNLDGECESVPCTSGSDLCTQMLRSPSRSHPSRSKVVKALSRAHPVILHVQFIKGQRNWHSLSFSFSVWQWGGRRPGKSETFRASQGPLLGLPGVLWMMTQPY